MTIVEVLRARRLGRRIGTKDGGGDLPPVGLFGGRVQQAQVGLQVASE